ncbi:MAG: 50S ribosomal protein L21 [Candidatus Niyogibacteria bacterium]|nr:50S ribosomal protein L21 [Candidatus Niyogibacteria bacterium]
MNNNNLGRTSNGIKTAKKTANAPNSFAVIETGGKQYLVEPGMELKIEKIPKPAKGQEIKFDKILLASDGQNVKIGAPYLKEAAVMAEIKKEGRNRKVLIFRYHSKTRYRKKKGHRQPYSEIKIKEINPD